MEFNLQSEFKPSGDQPQAIEALVNGVEGKHKHQVLLGITGSGKTFAMANVVQQLQRPTLVIAHNKTLAAQLYNEFQTFFPENAVEYFVSYYDYYQPEAYVPSSDTFIEKDSSVNDEIDRLRHSATAALLTRRDTIVVASVSCIYGLGNPEMYEGNLLVLRVGEEIEQRAALRMLIEMRYERNDVALDRGKFRVRGDTLEIQPAYEESIFRISLFGDEVESITEVDPVTGERLQEHKEFVIFPATHYAADSLVLARATARIEKELQERLAFFKSEEKLFIKES